MDKYLVFFEQYDRMEPQHHMNMFIANDLVDLCKTCEWLESAVRYEFNGKIYGSDDVIDWIDNIDIGGGDGFAIYKIETNGLTEIANSGIMEIG